MRKVKVLSVMLWVALSLAAATYVGCKTNKPAEEAVAPAADSTQIDTTVIDTVK